MDDTLAQKAYHELRHRLRTGELSPGTRLVNRTLAADLGFSFTPVREAISRLASEGLVEYVHGAGAYVRKLDRQDLAELYDLRGTLEPFAAAEAAKHVSSLELEELGRVCDDFRLMADEIRAGGAPSATAAQMERWLTAEEYLHELVIRAARNQWLTRMAVGLRVVSMVFGTQGTEQELLTPAVADTTWRDHARLLELLGQRDAEAAHDWMSTHIRQGRDHVLAHFKTRDGWK